MVPWIRSGAVLDASSVTNEKTAARGYTGKIGWSAGHIPRRSCTAVGHDPNGTIALCVASRPNRVAYLTPSRGLVVELDITPTDHFAIEV